ncbi:hypothetical protein HU200_022950 [Digitaria exilis]|uniref:Uncharacterized protein n=1 Tax=Digitaria exilis TaxID=1010633 RepID=A0A835CCI2_9POAL|nr:hypothetical protein HU200_022950 [Digitaria exilis]
MTQQRRRQALEQEVAELKQQLSNEQTVHNILERALHQPSSAVLSTIPAFIPTKAKELLAELLLVEEEIARLEAQIQDMKAGAGRSRGLLPTTTNTSMPLPPPDASARSPRPSAAVAPPPSPEIKSMFFISQAMDGDYFNKHVKSPSKASSGSPKNSIFALPPTSGSSRHSLDNNNNIKQQQQQQQQTAANKILHELPISKNTKREDHPNKLSERIVKCLVCIFIRLLRSSRAAELDKSSGNIARSGGNLQGSFSFRIDTGLNVITKDKDRGQQDHYGIFAVQDAIVRDIGPYKNLVRFTSSSFDLRGFSSSPLLTKLRQMLEALQQGILQHGLPSNSEKLLALKNKVRVFTGEEAVHLLLIEKVFRVCILVQATINVSGQKFNALVIENLILRQPSSVKEEFWKCDVDVEEQQVRGVYGLKNSEPNILFALCCGIRSSPALRIYKADRVAMDLEKAKLEYLQASLVVTSTRRLLIPGLIHTNMHDFAKDMESLVRWICEQLPTSWSLRKSMVDCLSLRGQTTHLKMDEVVDVIPLDYEFQYLLPM